MRLEKLEESIGYRFKNKLILKNALTHTSYANENNVQSNEKLEFLGDSILEFISSKYIYSKYPNLKEGEMTKVRADVVCEKSLYKVALKHNFSDFLYIGKSQIINDGNKRPSIIPRSSFRSRSRRISPGNVRVSRPKGRRKHIDPDCRPYLTSRVCSCRCHDTGAGSQSGAPTATKPEKRHCVLYFLHRHSRLRSREYEDRNRVWLLQPSGDWTGSIRSGHRNISHAWPNPSASNRQGEARNYPSRRVRSPAGRTASYRQPDVSPVPRNGVTSPVTVRDATTALLRKTSHLPPNDP